MNGVILTTNNGGNNWNRMASGATNIFFDLYLYDYETAWVVGNSGAIIKYTCSPTPTNEPLRNENPYVVCYPNPVSTTLTVKLDQHLASKTSIQLYNILGQSMKLILPENMLMEGEHEFSVDMEHYPPGAYLLNVNSGTASQTVRVLKMR